MKAAAVVLASLFVLSTASPARAQLGALGKIKKAADKGADAKAKYDDYNIDDKDERHLVYQFSLKLSDQFV
jgi:hypothetical protein